MKALKFFDCNCRIGMRSIVNPGSFYKTEDLVGKMKYYGIEKALVYHSMAREYSPIIGNEMLTREIANFPSLYPVWIVMPHHTGEFPSPGILVEQLRKYNVRAVRMFPSQFEQNFSIAPWNCGELYTKLDAHRIPIFISLDQLSWNDIYELRSNYPKLRIILTEVNYRTDRNLYFIMEKFPNIFIEVSGYKVHHGIEEICRRYGAERLIYGSGMPVYTGSSVSVIHYARISGLEKRKIAYENLNTILEEVTL
jgi:hypothetical protein